MAVKTQRMGRDERREQILAIAHRAFVRGGYEGVSMDRIAAAAGITKPILYRHFDSKDGLCAATAELMVEPMLAAVRAATQPDLPPDRQLWAGILAQLEFIDTHRDEWRLYVVTAPARGGLSQAALADGRRRVTALLGDLMRQAVRSAGLPAPPSQEVDAQAHALQGAVEQVASWWEDHPEEPTAAVALRVMNFAWQGFGNILRGELWLPPS